MDIIAKKGKLIIAEKGDMIYLSGAIDGDSNFDPILEKRQKTIRLSLKGVEQVTSNGVSKLLHFVKKTGDRPLEFHECPVETIGMFTIVPALLGKGKARIKSFYASYVCPECDRESSTLCRPEEFSLDDDGNIEAPKRNCSIHGGMVFDDEIEDFMQIVKES